MSKAKSSPKNPTRFIATFKRKGFKDQERIFAAKNADVAKVKAERFAKKMYLTPTQTLITPLNPNK